MLSIADYKELKSAAERRSVGSEFHADGVVKARLFVLRAT